MAHEQSETIEQDGLFYNVYGQDTAKAGQRLPDTPAYKTLEAAIAAAKTRSDSSAKSSMSFEDFAGGVPAKKQMVPGSPDDPRWAEVGAPRGRIPADVRAGRNAEAQQILQREETGEGLRTSSVVEGSTATPTAQPTSLSFEDFAKGTTEAPSQEQEKGQLRQQAQAATQRTLLGMKRMGGEAAALADFVLSIPGFLVGAGTQLTGTVRAIAEGSKEPFAQGRAVGEHVREPLMNPLFKIVQMIGGEDFYEGALTTQAMNKFGEALEAAGKWVEEKSNGRIARDAVPMFVETLMAGSSGLGGRKPGGIDPRMQKTLRDSAERLRTQAEAELAATREIVSPEAQLQRNSEAVARRPVQQQINEMLGIKTSAERAKEVKAKRKDVKTAFERPAEGSDYVDIAESQFRAQERLDREAAVGRRPTEGTVDAGAGEGSAYEIGSSPRPERVGQAEILRIMQKPGFERTAQDLLTLRRARQEGKASPEALALMSAAGIGATLGGLLDDEQLRGATLGGLTAASAAAPFMFRGSSVPRGKGQSGMFTVATNPTVIAAAERATNRGVDRKKVWQDFGVFKGRDGKWREEISDAGAELISPEAGGLKRNTYAADLVSSPGIAGPMRMGDILSHPELWKKHPEIADAPVKSTGFNFDVKGAFSEKTGEYALSGGRPEKVRGTLLHEIQHGLQAKEGTARGGNVEQFLSEAHKAEAASVSTQLTKLRQLPELQGVSFDVLDIALEGKERGRKLYTTEKQHLEKLEKLPLEQQHEVNKLILRKRAVETAEREAAQKYRRLAGEVEARATADRGRMTGPERRATAPWESFDVPEANFIMSFKPGEMSAVKEAGGMWHPDAAERLAQQIQSVQEGTRKDLTNLQQYVKEQTSAQKAKEITETLTYKRLVETVARGDWANKAVQRYLNKHAGTKTDPLKDIEIPFRQEVMRWEDVTDGAIIKKSVAQIDREGYFNDLQLPQDARQRLAAEPVWDISRSAWQGAETVAADSRHALSSYFSHVGDYLRQNVPIEKLPQYDFVRAAKETYQNDLRVAKEMEKAAAETTAQLPVYREYPDGMKWVEITAPEQLTPEQMKGVKKATYAEEATVARNNNKGASAGYIALDTKGEPIRNSYTGSSAFGKTPREAYIAGRLAEEGNQMGHCVGGYCEGVAAGEAKIYSLRDKKGQSHVTVEVEGTPDIRYSGHTPLDFIEQASLEIQQRFGNFPGEASSLAEQRAWKQQVVASKEFGDWLKQKPSSIIQVKGKQNRAPDSKYLPYVQDFVKGEQWGRVDDLQNTGLAKMEGKYLTAEEIRPMVEAELANYAPKEKHTNLDSYIASYADGTIKSAPDLKLLVDMLRKARENKEASLPPGGPPRGPGRNQAGFMDQKLVNGLGLIGLGGLIGSLWADDPLHGLLLGSVAGGVLQLPGVRSSLKEGVKGLEQIGGMVSTRIKNKSPELHQRLITNAQQELEVTHRMLDRTLPWLEAYREISAADRLKLNTGLFLKDSELIAAVNKGNQKLVAGWREVRNTLTELGTRAQSLGRFKELLDDYFPQRVKDFQGLKDYLGQEVQTQLSRALKAAEERAARRGSALSDVERDAVINRILRHNFKSISHAPAYGKARRIEEVTAELQKFYHTPPEALAITLSEIVKDLELAKLFGRDLVQHAQNGRTYTDVSASIGNILGRLMEEGKIKPDDFKELQSMLLSRFGPGERSPNRTIQAIQNLGYAGLLSDLPSAIVQLADPAYAIPAHGLRSTIVAVARRLSGNARITAKDLFLMDHIAEDLAFGSTQLGGSVARTRAAVGGGAAIGAIVGALLQDDISGAIPGVGAGAFLGYAGVVGTAAALNKTLKQGVFSPIDRFGKDIQLGAAHEKVTRWAQGGKSGLEKLQRDHGEAFGPEFPQLVADLKRGELTPRVRSLLFAELSRTQPISKLEAPQALLDNPNARPVWMLKRFMLKQIDFMRRDAFADIATGKPAKVTKGLGKLGETLAVLGISGATTAMLQDYLLGREVDFGATEVAENVLKTFGLSRYVIDKMKEGGSGPIQAIGASFLPPFAIMDRIITADPKAVQYIPVIGQIYYNWELGGQEAAEVQRHKQKKKDGEESDLSFRAQEYQERRREKARQKREEALR